MSSALSWFRSFEDLLKSLPARKRGRGKPNKSVNPLRQFIETDMATRGVIVFDNGVLKTTRDYPAGDPREPGDKAGGGYDKVGRPSLAFEAYCREMLPKARAAGTACTRAQFKQIVRNILKRHPVGSAIGAFLRWDHYRRAPRETPKYVERFQAPPSPQRDTRDTTGRQFGDPMPGRSAFDKRSD
jgi:hypothetical protein